MIQSFVHLVSQGRKMVEEVSGLDRLRWQGHERGQAFLVAYFAPSSPCLPFSCVPLSPRSLPLRWTELCLPVRSCMI